MVCNRSLDRLVDAGELAAFVQAHGLAPHNLVGQDHSGLLLARGAFVIDISEALRDISVVITLADARHRLWVTAEGAQDMCRQLGLTLPDLQVGHAGARQVRDAFLSHMDDKLRSLLDELPPVVALMEHVAERGGLSQVTGIAPAPPFHLHPYVRPLPVERLTQYRMAVVLGPSQ